MNVADWFDPYDEKHLRGYKYYMNYGDWPDGFFPSSMGKYPYIGADTRIIIMSKMANAWLKAMLPNSFDVASIRPIEVEKPEEAVNESVNTKLARLFG